MSDDDTISCDAHGDTRVTYVCSHVATGVACGFHAPADPNDPWPDATCDACRETADRATEPGAIDDQITLLCTHCWEAARRLNERVPPLARGRAARFTAKERDRFVEGACRDLHERQESAQARWKVGLGSNATEYMKWRFDDEAMTLTFSDDERRVIATVRMVGSYSTRSNSFQWAWATFGEGHPNGHAAGLLRAFGDVRGVDALTRTSWACEIEEAWDMAAIAAYLLGAEAVYRMPYEHTFWFMLLDDMRDAGQ